MRDLPQAPCLALIRAFEQGPHGGFASTCYQDPAGFWTIGYGHRLDAFTSDVWTEEQADAQALTDLGAAANGVCLVLGVAVDSLTDNQYAACIDFAFNLGVGSFSGSTLAHYIKVGSMNLVPGQFSLWVYAHVNGAPVRMDGLVRRRDAEIQLWNTPDVTPDP